MAEQLSSTRSAAAYQLGQKAHPTAFNRARSIVVSMPAAYASIAAGDTVATNLVIPAGSRLVNGVFISNAANAASVTVAVGIRDAITKVAIDATAIAAATAITSAANALITTGTKLTGGQEYYVPSDAEVYLTFAGAASTANAQLRIEVPFISP